MPYTVVYAEVADLYLLPNVRTPYLHVGNGETLTTAPPATAKAPPTPAKTTPKTAKNG